MSVFTPLAFDELEAFLADYDLGRLRGFQGIAAGSENSNFFVSLESGEYVLTLVERGLVQDLPFFVELLEVLHQAQLPVPYAIPGRDGHALRRLKERPALLQPRLAGNHLREPNPHHCREVGDFQGRLHLATCGARMLERRSDRGIDWMLAQAPAQLAGLAEADRQMLEAVLTEVGTQQQAIQALPRANLHADLFKDNALFEGAHLAGVIDFYNACSGPMLYDLAIAVNDWCSDASGRLDTQRAESLLAAYAAQRHFSVAEVELWPLMLRLACLRFWLSRAIAAEAFAGQEVLIHDPGEFLQRLRHRQQVAIPLPMAL